MSRSRVLIALLTLGCTALFAGACGRSSVAPEPVIRTPLVNVVAAPKQDDTAEREKPGASEDEPGQSEEASRRGGSKYSVIFY